MKPSSGLAETRLLFALWLVIFAVSTQIMVVAPILNGIGEELSIRTARLADLLTVYPAMVGIFALVAGPISDRVGRRSVLIWGSGIMTGALILHGVAWDYWSLVSFRAMAGVGGGVLSGAAVALVGDFFPSDKRGWANGWMMTGLAVGQIVGIPAGTLLAGAFGFRMPFMVLAGVSALAVLSVVLWVPFIDPAGERLSLGSAIRGYGALLKRSDAAIASLAFVAVCFSIASFVSYLPAWLETDFGFTPSMVAGLYLIGGLGTIIAGPRAGRLSDRLGRRSVILGSSAGLIVFALTVPAASQVLALAVFPAFLGFNVFVSARGSAYQAMLSELVDARERGAMMSLSTAAGQIGFASGAAASGPTFAAFGFGSVAALTAVSATTAGLLVWWFLPEPTSIHRYHEDDCPCNQLQMQPVGCGPTPESGHMARVLQPPKQAPSSSA